MTISGALLAASILGILVAQFAMWRDIRALQRREWLREKGLFR